MKNAHDAARIKHYKVAMGAGRPERFPEPTLIKTLCPKCGEPVNRTGSFDCPNCSERIFIPVLETDSK